MTRTTVTPRCPVCASEQQQAFVSPSPDTDIFRCRDCGHVWTAPAPFVIVPADRPLPIGFAE